jgi:hypothetical protein
LADSITPVLLHQTQTKYPQPIFRLYLRKNNLLSNAAAKLACYDAFQLVIQELDIHLEQQTVVAAWDTAQKTADIWFSLFPTLFDSQEATIKRSTDLISNISQVTTTTDNNKLYIDRFNLNSIKINISFIMTPDLVFQNRERSQNRDMSQRFQGGGILYAFSSFLKQVGEVVLDLSSNISNASIEITGMNKENLSMSQRELTNKLQSIYFQSIVSQVL